MRYAGFGVYLRNLVSCWAKTDTRNEYLVVSPENLGLDLPPRFRQQILPAAGASVKRYITRIVASSQCREFRPEVVFQPNMDFPSAYPPGAGWVCVVHDMIPTLFLTPEFLFTGKTPARMISTYGIWKLLEFKRHLPRVDRIVTVSKTSRACLLRVLGRSAARKVRVVYNGMRPAVPSGDQADIRSFVEARGLSYKRYLIYFGGHSARKHLGLAVRAYQQLPPALKEKYPFVILGKGYWTRWIKRRGMGEGLRFLPTAPERELAKLVSGAALSIYPSLYEGFGLPVVESLHLGTLPLASDIPSTRELCGSSIPLFNPYRLDELYALLVRYLGEPARAARKMEQARARLPQDRTWAHCAEETLAIMESVLRESRGAGQRRCCPARG